MPDPLVLYGVFVGLGLGLMAGFVWGYARGVKYGATVASETTIKLMERVKGQAIEEAAEWRVSQEVQRRGPN